MKNNLHIQSNGSDYLDKSTDKIPSAFDEREKANFPSASEIYNAVFENSFHAVYIGTATGEILKFNKKLCNLFGYSEDELRHIKYDDLFVTNDEAFRNFIKERKEKGIVKVVITCIKKSGERFPCRISSVVYQSDHGEKRSMNTLVDISDNLSARWNLSQ